MQNLLKLTAIFSENNGLEIKTEVIPVVKENKKAIVLETDDFKTVYKGEAKQEYLDYVDVPKYFTVFGTGQIVGVGGYFSSKELAEKSAKHEVSKYLLERSKYYGDLIALFEKQIEK